MLKRGRSEKRRGWEPPAEGILLVCDDPDAGELLARLIDRDGHDVHRVETAEGALRHLLATPRLGAVLSLSGPTANRQLTDKIRSHPNPPVAGVALVLLADDDAEAAPAWEAGVDGFLVRPFHADDLSATLKAAIGRTPDERAAHRQDQLDAF
jgi:DNA-binding response OmpR family regulator